jgi:glycosyltransferase involved in cell wall biosynthesis
MSYGLSVLVSDIPPNKEVALPDERYFMCGDADDLKNKLEILLDKDLTETEKSYMRLQIAGKYNWQRIAEQTIEVHKEVECGFFVRRLRRLAQITMRKRKFHDRGHQKTS